MTLFTAPPFPVPSYMAPMPPGGPPPITPAPPVALDQGMVPLPTTILTDDEPLNKKLRSEDNLIPEAEFIAMHKVNEHNTIKVLAAIK